MGLGGANVHQPVLLQNAQKRKQRGGQLIEGAKQDGTPGLLPNETMEANVGDRQIAMATPVDRFPNGFGQRGQLLEIGFLHFDGGRCERQFFERHSHREPITNFVLGKTRDRGFAVLLAYYEAGLLQLNQRAANGCLADLERFGEAEFPQLFGGLEFSREDCVLILSNTCFDRESEKTGLRSSALGIWVSYPTLRATNNPSSQAMRRAWDGGRH